MKSIKKQYFVYPPEMMLSLYLAVLGFMIPEIQKTFSLSLTDVGLFSTMQSIGMVVSLMLCFCIFSGLNKARIMMFASFVVSICIILLGINRITFLLYVLFFFIGLFNNIMDTISNALIIDLSKEKTGFYVGLLHSLWAAAGIAGPYFAILLGSEYTTAFLGLGILTALTSFVYMLGLNKLIRQPLLKSRQNMGTTKKLLRILKIPAMKLHITTSFFSSFTQMSFIYFISSYFSSLRGFSSDGAFAVSMLFLGFLIGRIIYSTAAHRFSTFKLMFFANACAIAAFALMLFSNDIIVAGIFATIGGVCISANSPGLVVEACSIVPSDTAAASALIFAGVAASCFAAPPIIGAVGDLIGLQTALLINTAMQIPIVVLTAISSKRFVPTQKYLG